jgi:GT2 family glycosyltransferase
MLSIIIPVYNQHEMSIECINTIRECTQGDYEFVIIDNGSEPPFKPPFTGFNETVVIRNDKNRGFPIAINQGIRAAKGDIIIILNNDIAVIPGWAERLISALGEFDIVGPVTNYCAGLQQIQINTYENKDELNQAAEDLAENYGDSVQEVNFLIGFCMAFKKSIFDEIGQFDEDLWPCSGEEVDFCFRAMEKGYRVGIVSGCYVHHEGSKTFEAMQRDGQLDYAEVCKKTDEHLNKKWGGNFWERQAINSSPVPKGICLNLGSGYRKLEGFVNIDNRPETKPDILCDVMEGLPYDDNSIDIVRADDFLEHISMDLVIRVMEEIWRVLRPGGIFESSTPSTDGRGAFQDPTHRSFWNRNSWLYYSDPAYRNLHGIKADFEIESIEDTQSDPAWMIIHTHVIARKR